MAPAELPPETKFLVLELHENSGILKYEKGSRWMTFNLKAIATQK